jgi:hypothetical protein
VIEIGFGFGFGVVYEYEALDLENQQRTALDILRGWNLT